MKKALLIIGLFVFAGTANIFAQSETSNAEDGIENVAVIADKAAAEDENIEKKVCQKSGKVSYVRKDVCEKSGKVSYTNVSYDAAVGKFVSLEASAKEGKSCASKAKASGCCSSKNKAKAAKAEPALTPQG
jgi:hypothetical protein